MASQMNLALIEPWYFGDREDRIGLYQTLAFECLYGELVSYLLLRGSLRSKKHTNYLRVQWNWSWKISLASFKTCSSTSMKMSIPYSLMPGSIAPLAVLSFLFSSDSTFATPFAGLASHHCQMKFYKESMGLVVSTHTLCALHSTTNFHCCFHLTGTTFCSDWIREAVDWVRAKKEDMQKFEMKWCTFRYWTPYNLFWIMLKLLSRHKMWLYIPGPSTCISLCKLKTNILSS